ncbi:hypothetical protein EST38_g10120 [Candolleomyces aberdarensis]|uniref:Uncharacterized protein n=1 Tax=Candolleomyces aberdarensis TaxID=2316362 RepID=A0A4V1Q2N8_9AGAR|nr:hypothetical protein EST38_g10120 [Candolleomyces aberdarensis]
METGKTTTHRFPSSMLSLGSVNRCLSSSLPPEILSSIFEMVYVELCCDYGYEDELEWEEAEDDELAELSVFPNALSRVCRYWDAVLATFPEFWTRIVVHPDQPYHIELLKAALKRSDPHKIHSLTIIQSVEGQGVNDGQERDKMIKVLKVAEEEVFRIKALTIKTYTSDSLPRIPFDWDALGSLRFESFHRGDHALGPHPSIHDPSDETVDWKNLCVLSLTGPAFVTLSRGASWQKAVSSKTLDSLTISRLRARDGGEKPFTFHELWASYRAFFIVGHLTLMDVDVPYVPGGWEEHETPSCHCYSLSSAYTFDAIPARVLRAFYHDIEELARSRWNKWSRSYSSSPPYPDVDQMIFRNCQFFGFQKDDRTLSSNVVEVADITHSDSLSICFEMVEAQELRIRNCLGLDDSSIEAMTLPLRKQEQRPALRDMYGLEIVNCPKFSIASLRELVERRKEISEYNNLDQEERVSPIARLVLRGSCPLVSDEDEKWFRENVEDFEIDREA